MAIIRLAALYENRRFAALLDDIDPGARMGIIATRNYAVRHGMDDEVLWKSTTVSAPGLIDRVRARHGL